MNTPKAVADELLALINDRDEIKKALIELGAVVADDDGLSSYPDKIRGLKPARLKIFKKEQFYQWKDKVLPDMEFDESFTSHDMSWLFGRCPNLVAVPNIGGIETATDISSFIRESSKVTHLTLPDMPMATKAEGVSMQSGGLTSLTIGDMPLVETLRNAFRNGDVLEYASIGDAPKVKDVYCLFYLDSKLKRVKLSLDGGLITDCKFMFEGCSMLEEVEGVINISSVMDSTESMLSGCAELKEIRIKGCMVNISMHQSPKLSLESARFLISEAQNVSTPKVISLPQSLVDRYPSEMAELGGVASGKGWTITYR